MKSVKKIGKSEYLLNEFKAVKIKNDTANFCECAFKQPKPIETKQIKQISIRHKKVEMRQNAIGNQSSKCVIYCPSDKVKQYTQIIKNSQMQPVAVIANDKQQNEKKLSRWSYFLFILIGVIIGFANGFFGGGGGMLCVPLLIYILALPDKKAHATALLIMLPISLVSIIIYSINLSLDLKITAFVMVGSILGGVVGSLLLKKLSNVWIRAIFAFIMIFAGIKMIW